MPKAVLRDTAMSKAREVVKLFLTPYMDYRMVQDVGALSEDFLRGVRVIQKFLRFKE